MVAMDYWEARGICCARSECNILSSVVGGWDVCPVWSPSGATQRSGAELWEPAVQWGVPAVGSEKGQDHPLHPQSDGSLEHFNHILVTQLAILTSQHQRDWDQRLPLVLWAYRTAVQESSQCIPAALMLGRELRTPVDLVFVLPPEPENWITFYSWKGTLTKKRAYDPRNMVLPLHLGTESGATAL